MKTKSPVLWIVVIAVSFFALGYLASLFIAQSGRKEVPTYVERLDEALGLSEDQEKKLRTILAEEDRQISAIIDSVRAPVVDEIQSIRRKAAAEIRDILDDTQRKLFDEGGFSPAGDF